VKINPHFRGKITSILKVEISAKQNTLVYASWWIPARVTPRGKVLLLNVAGVYLD
jgi:hypothetical protein